MKPGVALLACALLSAGLAAAGELVPLPAQPEARPWPTSSWPDSEPSAGVDRAELEGAVDELFASVGRGGVTDTRALLVVQGGAIVFERYAPGFGPTNRFESWSMAKSVTNALVAVLVRDGALALDAPAQVPAWHEDADPRAAITLRQLLNMSSGLDNADNDGGGDFADSFGVDLLFGARSADMAAGSAEVPLVHAPGEHWAYSTGTSMVVAAIVGQQVGGDAKEMVAFMRREVFAPIGMTSAVPEFDAAGNFMGGAFVHASARDWARFGYLYLRDGVWDGRRILPAGWVDFTRTPGPAANNHIYGAHFWLNGEPGEGQWPVLPGGPPDAFAAEGSNAQIVDIVPSRDLVVVRLGDLQATDWPVVKQSLARLVMAFPPVSAPVSAVGAAP